MNLKKTKLAQGQPLTEKESALVKDPSKDLLNKNMSFLFKVNGISNLNSLYEVFTDKPTSSPCRMLFIFFLIHL